MPREQSPYFRKKISIIKLGELTEELAKFDRVLWINPCKNSHVRLMEGGKGTVMGPMPNWKAHWILSEMLRWERKQKHAQDIAMATVQGHIQNGKLFVTAA